MQIMMKKYNTSPFYWIFIQSLFATGVEFVTFVIVVVVQLCYCHAMPANMKTRSSESYVLISLPSLREFMRHNIIFMNQKHKTQKAKV